nr:MAG TPA: hypothetical protein [Caudoviricetes sp.]
MSALCAAVGVGVAGGFSSRFPLPHVERVSSIPTAAISAVIFLFMSRSPPFYVFYHTRRQDGNT